jgi:hypothetical protein
MRTGLEVRTLGIPVGISCRFQSIVISSTGRLVKEIDPFLPNVQEPIRGRGSFARSSMILDIPR